MDSHNTVATPQQHIEKTSRFKALVLSIGARLLGLWTFGRPSKLPFRHVLGIYGEIRAEIHLKALGYEVIGRRLKSRTGEIDLLAIDNNCLVIIEVKTRSLRSQSFRSGLLSIDNKKMDRLQRLSQAVIRRYSLSLKRLGVLDCRVDAIEVIYLKRLRVSLWHWTELIATAPAFQDWPINRRKRLLSKDYML